VGGRLWSLKPVELAVATEPVVGGPIALASAAAAAAAEADGSDMLMISSYVTHVFAWPWRLASRSRSDAPFCSTLGLY